MFSSLFPPRRLLFNSWPWGAHRLCFLSYCPVRTWILKLKLQFSSVQLLSCVRLFSTPWISTPGLPVHHQLPEFTQTHVHPDGDAIQTSHPLSSPSPPAPNPSQHQSFPMSQLFAWGGKHWSFSFSISPSNEHPGLISQVPKKTNLGWFQYSPYLFGFLLSCILRVSQYSFLSS